MLSISELGKFYYLRNFHDMRCKYGRVLSVIHQQMNREPQAGEVYIMMSKDCQTVRLYSYDRHRRYAFTVTTGTRAAFTRNALKKVTSS